MHNITKIWSSGIKEHDKIRKKRIAIQEDGRKKGGTQTREELTPCVFLHQHSCSMNQALIA
jgi:hypothetical protein